MCRRVVSCRDVHELTCVVISQQRENRTRFFWRCVHLHITWLHAFVGRFMVTRRGAQETSSCREVFLRYLYLATYVLSMPSYKYLDLCCKRLQVRSS